MPKSRGGQGLDVAGMAACYEEMGRSIFGPVAFNCAAPDDGNMMLLEKVATEAQKERWLQPIVDGKVRSAFALTAPPPGDGPHPGLLSTRPQPARVRLGAKRHQGFITGATPAQHPPPGPN